VETQRGRGVLNIALLNSLKTIQAANSRFHLLTERGSTQAVLVSQIELCDVLLEEIRTISCSLEKRMKSCSVIGRRSVLTSRNRSSRYRPVPQRDALNRSKRRK
jgi:hypothetical protein